MTPPAGPWGDSGGKPVEAGGCPRIVDIMCDAYTLAPEPAVTRERHPDIPLDSAPWNGERLIRPGTAAPVLMPDHSMIPLAWGFQRPFLQGLHLAEAGALGGQPWKLPFTKGRCLVPVTSFFEVEDKRGAGKIYEISSPDGGWLWVAGLWDVKTRRPSRFSMIMVETPVIGHVVQRPAVLDEEQARAYLLGELNTIPTGPIAFKCVEVAAALRIETNRPPELENGKPPPP